MPYRAAAWVRSQAEKSFSLSSPVATASMVIVASGLRPFCMRWRLNYFTGMTVEAGTVTAVTLFCGEPSIRRSE